MASMVGNPTGSVGEGVRQAAMAKAAGREPVNLSKGILARGASARNRAEKAESQQDFRERQRAGQRGKQVRENIRGEKAFGPGVQNFTNPGESYIGRKGP